MEQPRLCESRGCSQSFYEETCLRFHLVLYLTMTTNVHSSLPPLYRSAIDALSADRFGPYLRASGGDPSQALELYHWNMRVSGALYEALHIVEVALRNAIDRELSKWNVTQINPETNQARSTDWLVDTPPLLVRVVKRQKIEEATQRAQRHITRRRVNPSATSVPSHSDILAQLSFGTWRFILKAPGGRRPDPGSVLLWRDVFPASFPHLSRTPRELVEDVKRIYDARNRVAHLEPLLDQLQIGAVRDAVDRVLSDIDPLLSTWFSSQERMTEMLK